MIVWTNQKSKERCQAVFTESVPKGGTPPLLAELILAPKKFACMHLKLDFLSKIQSVKISLHPFPKHRPLNSCVSCLSGMKQRCLAGFIVQFHKIYTSKFLRAGQWVPRPGSVSKS